MKASKGQRSVQVSGSKLQCKPLNVWRSNNSGLLLVTVCQCPSAASSTPALIPYRSNAMWVVWVLSRRRDRIFKRPPTTHGGRTLCRCPLSWQLLPSRGNPPIRIVTVTFPRNVRKTGASVYVFITAGVRESVRRRITSSTRSRLPTGRS